MPTSLDSTWQRWLRAAAGALVAAVLTACSVARPLLPAAAPAVNPAIASAGLPADPAVAGPSAVPALPRPVAGSKVAPAPGEILVRLLGYADRVRSLGAAELNQEVARLGTAYLPADQVQLALVLSQLRQTPELVRAQEVLTRLLANSDPDAQALHPLARLLAARYGEQRRLEDLADRQGQQTRDVQRRLDQTNERLEALKAIERSLTSRPPTAAPQPSPAPPAAPAAAPVSRARSRSSAP